nr:hypothetical protein [Tanacetum cinerariifolium]
MATTIEQQVALDEAFVRSTKRLRIGRSNFRLPSDIQSKESTLQVVYDVLRISPFFKAFLVTADVPEIYMQEFWATSYVHQHSIRFKMDTRKNIVDLEAFREMLHISPRVPGQSFDELPFEEEILDFLRFLGHSAQIKTLSDNTQQYGAILHIEFTNEDIRNTKDYKEYYACATEEAAPKPKASARRKRGGSDSSTTTPPTAVASPRPITTVVVAPRLTAAAKGKQPARATSPYDPLEVERTEAEQLKIVLRMSRQETHISQHGGSSTNEGTGSKPGVPDVPYDDSEEEISWNSSDDEDVDAQDKSRDDDEGKKNDESDDGNDDDDQDDAERDDDDDDDDDEEEIAKLDEQEDTESGEGDAEETKSDGESEEEQTREEEEESFDPIPRTPEDSEDDGNSKEDQGLRISEEQRLIEEEEADELDRDIDINQGWGLQVSQDIEDSHVTLTPVQPDGQQESSSVSLFVTSMLNPISDVGVESIFTTASSPIAPLQTSTHIMTPSTIATIKASSDAPIPPIIIPSATNQFAEAVSNIPDSFQRENDEFLRTIDENMKKIIKGQVKSQVKEQVSRILPRIKESVNAQLEAEVLTRSSHSSRMSYAVAADLTEMELKKILMEKMEGNKSIQRSDEQRNLYKALVDAYEADNTILESYGDTTILKRRCGDDDDQERLSARSNQGSKRRREGTEDQPIVQTSQHPEWFSQPRKPTTPDHQLDWVNPEGQQYPHNLLQPLPLIPDNRGRHVIPFAHFINNDLEYLRVGTSSRKYSTSVTKTKAADYGHIKWIEDLVPRTWGRKRQQFYGFAVNRESALDVYSKRRIIAVTDLKIVEWHNYKHLDYISDDCMRETSGCYKGPYDSSYAAPIFTE